MSNELMLVESKTMREEMVGKVSNERVDEIFNKVKGLVLLQDDTNITVEMASRYFEVDKETVKKSIQRHNDELIEDGLKILKGQELKDFKDLISGGDIMSLPSEIKQSSILTILPRRAILRLGMLLQDSIIAKQVRTYLLDVEGNTKTEDKLIALTQDSNNIVSLLNDKVDYLYQINNELKQDNSIIITDNEELKHNIQILITKVDELLEQPLFKIHENASRTYDMLIMAEFPNAIETAGIKLYGQGYGMFNKEFENWTGVTLNNKINKKQYWISYYGIENIRQFILGVAQKIIVKNEKRNWVSKSGIYSNKVEWKKILNEFDNRCIYCGSEDMLMAEHIIAQSSEGSSDCIHNLITSCPKCNKDKGTMDMKSWIDIKLEDGSMTEEQVEKIREHIRKYRV